MKSKRSATGVYTMSPAEETAVADGLAQAERGEFARDARVAELWKRVIAG